MGNHNNCMLTEFLPDQRLHELIRLRINIARRLVEHQNLAPSPQQRTCEAEYLLLAMRQRTGCHFSIEPTAFLDNVPELDFSECGNYSVIWDGGGWVGVETHGTGEDERLLGNGDNLGAD